ncbi:MAG: flagellar filament capping protein FliD [Burkholderiaceae bacterium]|nr:flagellar filament capping protein FliD [Burkholderiaceae bacterium]
MGISSVAPTATSSGAAALSDTGIGSGLDVNSIVSKLMEVESQPVTQLNNQITSYQATLSAYGQVNSSLGSFQAAVQSLAIAANSIALGVTSSNTSVLSGTTTTGAQAGSYNVNVTQLAQAQSLAANGVASSTATIGSGASTTISFQFGTTGSGVNGSALGAAVASSGIAAGSLTIDGTTITTGSSTNSAAALVTQINHATAVTGVTATASNASSGTLSFSNVTTGANDAYTLSVGGVTVANVGANSSLSAAQLDAALQSTGSGSIGAQLAAAGITFTGTAAAGTLQFSANNGANLTLSQNLTNNSTTASGGIASINSSGATETYLGSVSLSASSTITVGGNDPAAAGLTAGTASNSPTFTQNSAIPGGSVTVDSSDSSLQGIAKAINGANLGVTAAIISDGSSTPYRLVLTSNTTGAAASMKISVSGDSTISNLLSEDPAGTENLTQSVAAQNTNLTVNGIAVTSANNTVSGAIQGVNLTVAQTGSTTVSVAQNTSTLQSAVSSFVTAYNSLNSVFTQATAYNASTQTAGPLIGDSGVATVQQGLRQILGSTIPGLNANLSTLQQLGITFQSDGSMQLNSTTLQNAITSNANGVASLFGAIGNASDNLVSYKASTSSTQAGTYAVDITQLATQGTEVGSAAPNLTITAGSNDSLQAVIDGITANITIPAGTYTASSLAAEVQNQINGSSNVSNAGSSVAVTVGSNGALSITSKRYGSASVVNLTGTAESTLLGSSPTMTTGLDVKGTIGGNPATGSGQVLTGLTGSPTAGLALTINGGTTGARGTVTFSEGYASQLGSRLTSYLSSSGPISNETAGINNTINGLQAQITRLNQTLTQQQANYLAEFQALDTTIASLDATQTYLTQELASIASNSGG